MPLEYTSKREKPKSTLVALTWSSLKRQRHTLIRWCMSDRKLTFNEPPGCRAWGSHECAITKTVPLRETIVLVQYALIICVSAGSTYCATNKCSVPIMEALHKWATEACCPK